MWSLTTHALDTSKGTPATGLMITLYKDEDKELLTTRCNQDGRVSNMCEGETWTAGVYKIRFFTKDYFTGQGKECFYPHCDVTFEVSDASAHYHVPLLVSPYGYSTYRGS